ncbi:MAG TPA: aminoacyl-tRNA hydrolase [bacterium]|nr:aminoacyl-tRNA hydrolase [bacterium]HPN44876.1 aminoacyl-tRNA hydrolase [bacterium]
MSNTYLITGLGNPGRRYSKTRHNAGFMVIDRIISTFNGSLEKTGGLAEVAQVTIADVPVMVAKPQTYMNNSGLAVKALLQHLNSSYDHLLVIYDDINLEFGRLKIKGKGSSGGHNGMESILFHLGTDEFARLRIGIGQTAMPHDMVRFVLSGFTATERRQLPDLIDFAEKAVISFLTTGLEKTMNTYNTKLNK